MLRDWVSEGWFSKRLDVAHAGAEKLVCDTSKVWTLVYPLEGIKPIG